MHVWSVVYAVCTAGAALAAMMLAKQLAAPPRVTVLARGSFDDDAPTKVAARSTPRDAPAPAFIGDAPC